MSTTIIIIAVIAVAVVLIGMFFTYNNRETALRKEAEAQKGKIETVHDTMWKVIREKAQVSEKYRETFEKIYPELISGRYQDSDSAFKWIQEANPDFDTSLMKDLMQSIEVQRMQFQSAQARMLDVIRERDTLIESYPSRWFITRKEPIAYKVISSETTHKAIESAEEDMIDLFPSSKA